MSIRIVTHAYAVEYPQYAVFLRSQLSSLYKYMPNIPCKITICCLHDDERIDQVVNDFFGLMRFVEVEQYRMEPSSLFRRSVGRNEVALKSTEDLIWFCDVDNFMGKDCIDTIWNEWSAFDDPKPVYIWPQEAWIHRDNLIGDGFWKFYVNSRGPIYPDAFTKDFKRIRYGSAVGALQIMNGVFARSHGYLNGTKWTNPENSRAPVTAAEDVKFRKLWDGRGATINPPNLYRLRHSESGVIRVKPTRKKRLAAMKEQLK